MTGNTSSPPSTEHLSEICSLPSRRGYAPAPTPSPHPHPIHRGRTILTINELGLSLTDGTFVPVLLSIGDDVPVTTSSYTPTSDMDEPLLSDVDVDNLRYSPTSYTPTSPPSDMDVDNLLYSSVSCTPTSPTSDMDMDMDIKERKKERSLYFSKFPCPKFPYKSPACLRCSLFSRPSLSLIVPAFLLMSVAASVPSSHARHSARLQTSAAARDTSLVSSALFVFDFIVFFSSAAGAVASRDCRNCYHYPSRFW